jgi:hypothetical protein
LRRFALFQLKQVRIVMRRRAFLLGGTAVVVGLLAGFVLLAKPDAPRGGTCPLQHVSPDDSTASPSSPQNSAAPVSQFPPPKLALERPKERETPLPGAQAAAQPARQEATEPANSGQTAPEDPKVRSRAITTADLPLIRQMASRIGALGRAKAASQPAK